MRPGEPFSPGIGANVLQPIWRQRPYHWLQSAQGDITDSTLQLVSLADGAALLIDGAGPYPVRMTADGGRTWQSVALPNPPGVSSQGGRVYQALVLLPSGALVGGTVSAAGPIAWHLLPPGASGWQAIPSSILPADAHGLTVAGGRLWWYTPGAGATSPPRCRARPPGRCGPMAPAGTRAG